MPFLMLGNGQTNRHGTSFDFMGAMLELSRAQRKLMVHMIDQRNVDSNLVTHEALMAVPGVNKRVLDNHVPALIAIGLVKRIKRGLYMINPLAVLPPNGIEARAQWIAISPTSVKNETVATPVEG